MNTRWAIRLRIRDSETNEVRIKSVCKIIFENFFCNNWFITGLEATGKLGVFLSDQNYLENRKEVSFKDLLNLFTEEGQIIDMYLECSCAVNKSIFIIVQDGLYVNILNNGIRINKEIFGDYEEEDFELWENIFN